VIPLSRPDITKVEMAEVLSVLRTDTLSIGPKLEAFEARIASLLGVRHAVAVSSGTAGLHLAVRAAGITEDAEVLTTPFSFVASANVMLFERAIPVFADIDVRTMNLTPEGVENAIEQSYAQTPRGLINRHTGRRLEGLLPVDVFGHPVDIDGFRSIVQRYGLWLIEDACEAMGSEVFSASSRAWMPAGSLADMAVFAFYPNKQITTGEGGVVVTNDRTLADSCRMGRNQGRLLGSAWLDHAALGYNYRMDELSAALGVAQLKRFQDLRSKRQTVARWYEEALRAVPGLELPRAEPWARVNWFVYVVRLRPEVDREALIAFLQTRGVTTRAYFPPIHLQSVYRERFGFTKGMFPCCEAVAKTTLALPFFNRLTRQEIEIVASALHEGVKAYAIPQPA
jgi:perosamine synthetase